MLPGWNLDVVFMFKIEWVYDIMQSKQEWVTILISFISLHNFSPLQLKI